MAKVELGKATTDTGAAGKSQSAKELLKRSVAAARPQKSNMTAYGAIAIAGCLGLYFFSGPKVPEPDRSGLVEADGVVSQALPASVTGVTEDMRTETLDESPEIDAAVPAESVAPAPAGVMPADPGSGAADGAATGVAAVPGMPGALSSGQGGAVAEPTPASTTGTPAGPAATSPNKLAGTSAAGATLPAMFTAAAPGESPATPGLMMPAEMAPAKEAPKVDEVPAEVSLQERADRGDPDAMYQLGMSAVSNEDSDGLKKRFRYLQAAATRGSVPAMREVAGLHERGEGVLASERMAYVWATLATAFGEDMSGFRDRLAAKMSEDELESGQRAASATLKGFGAAAMEKAKAYKTVAKN